MTAMSISGKKILLVGGAGFIGHHLALHLKSFGAEVCILDSLQVNNLLSFISVSNQPDSTALHRSIIMERLQLLSQTAIPIFVQDARDYHAMSKVFNEFNPEIVVQLAAVAHADRSNKDPYSTFDHSLRTLENALDCSRDKVSQFIYFSSSMVYGNFKAESVTEETICEPLGIYGALKFAGEKLVTAYNQVFNLAYTIVRPSALYGERCVSERVCQRFIESSLNKKPVTVEGDGSARLDFTYIKDLIEGIKLIIENRNAKNQIFNITMGESRSLNEVIHFMKDHLPFFQVNYKERNKLEPTRGTLSIQKAKELLGYQPRYPIEKGLEDYLQWYKTFKL